MKCSFKIDILVEFLYLSDQPERIMFIITELLIEHVYINMIWFIVFNATLSNISAISWQSVLVEKGAGVPGENTDRLVWVVKLSNYLTQWAMRAL